MARFFIKKTDADCLFKDVKSALDWVGSKSIIKRNSRIFLKPNFTYPGYKEGVTTSPAFIEAAIKALKENTDNITIGESDGGNNAWPAEKAFEMHGLLEMQKKYGIKLAPLTKMPRKRVEVRIGGRKVNIELPILLLEETDVFITLPVPKIHMMTKYTGAIKNQWGCIPDVMRLYYHADFNEIINGINKLFRPRLALFDATFMLNRSGPMFGDLVKMGLMAVTDEYGAGDLVMANIMGLDAGSIEHFNVAMREGLMPKNTNDIIFNDDIAKFRKKKFYLKRTLHNYGALMLFKNRYINKIFYGTFISSFLQKINRKIKGNKFKIEQY